MGAIGLLGLTAQQEKFCRKLVEGMTQGEAAKAAGYYGPGVNVTATRLLKNAKIQSRIEKLEAEATYAANVTIVSLAEELDKAWKLAFVNKQAVGCIQATLAKAKMFGFVNDRPQMAVNQQDNRVTHIHLIAPDADEQTTLLDGDFTMLPHPLEQE